MAVARGSFDIQSTPRETSDEEGADAVARMVLEKTYAGDLIGTGRGQMLMCKTAVEGSAGYVAIEVVDATLGGRRGSFVLQHFGIMARNDGDLRVTVVPDSATGGLAGLSGDIDITIDDGAHRYELVYTLPD